MLKSHFTEVCLTNYTVQLKAQFCFSSISNISDLLSKKHWKLTVLQLSGLLLQKHNDCKCIKKGKRFNDKGKEKVNVSKILFLKMSRSQLDLILERMTKTLNGSENGQKKQNIRVKLQSVLYFILEMKTFELYPP